MSLIDKVFPLSLEGKYVDKGRWELTAPFEYNNPPVKIKIPIGFISDGASIPKLFYSLIGGRWTGKYVRAAIVHDFLYFKQIYSRSKSDRIFLQAMKILKVSWWRRRSMWIAVRAGAGWIWRRHKRELKNKKFIIDS